MHKVYIVGAGCGDPELLTLKAHRLITQYAEVIIYDRLIAPEIIAMIPEHVIQIYAGKSGKNHHMTQTQINNALVRHAKESKKVVRLKGGDPFIFGRGGEEVSFLQKHHIPCEVVAGIPAALGAAAALRIPLTHRHVAHSVEFITGHRYDDKPLLLEYEKLTCEHKSLVFYMARNTVDEITMGLLKAGMNSQMPVAIIESATLPHQKHIKTTLQHAPNSMQSFASPTLMIIGNVVDFMQAE